MLEEEKIDSDTVTDRYGLPKKLVDGLLLRWATPDDTEALADFNFRMHNENPDGEPELWLKDWTRDLMSGRHPTTKASDFAVVVDENDDDKIVSTIVLISQIWSYDGIQFGCGRPETVGTDKKYRRRGLVRAQFEAIHAKSEARDELVQAITGIPWYYRKFGYEMALDLGGSRRLDLSNLPSLASGQELTYHQRPATSDDLSLLKELYDIQCESSLITCCRDEVIWRYELGVPQKMNHSHRTLRVIETTEGEGIGYVELHFMLRKNMIRELAVRTGYSLREVYSSVIRKLPVHGEKMGEKKDNPLTAVTLNLGANHLAYTAFSEELDALKPPYAWFIRVPDLPRFLHRISPVLDRRLATSVMAGYSGKLRLNFYTDQLTLSFDQGRLREVSSYQPEHFFDGDAFFPDLTFLQLLFGYRSLDELKYAYADCFTEKADATILLNAIFPKRHSTVIPLN